MLTKEQREAIYRLALQQQHADLSDYLDSITAPEGWQLVPVEPTQKMLEAAIYDTSQDFGPDDYEATIGNYQAMLAAAPKPGDSNE